ncbi:hypothetical protein V6N11_014781 [Hibiscus sabdariffa]|uniref:Uncharacterized protein n=1 Tax=Hibiscus sabdariffa TaxID=183260 RepID=A0ABR2TQ38_9ROSI
MKREGRQHGMVRTYRILPSPLNPKPESRFIQQFDLPPTAGLFTKVPVKPTNHSKFTGRPGFKDFGFSASMVLDHLSNHDDDDDDVDDDECVVNDSFKVNSQPLGEMKDYEGEVEENIVDHSKDDDDVKKDDAGDGDDDNDDDGDVEEEGWCLVGGI